VLEPIFEADMLDCSFGFRPGRSAHDALQVLIDESWRGRRWVVETDIANCFEAIPHSGLMQAIEERVCDRAVLAWEVRPAGRADVQRPVSGVRCPVSGVQASGVQVSGRTGLRCPRQCRRAVRVALDLEWLGVGAAGWAQLGRGAPGSAGGWSPASGLTGSDGAAVGRARLPRGRPSPRADAWPASRLRRRLAAGPTRAGPGPGCRPGGGARDAAGAHRSPRRASGRSPAWCPIMGLDQEVVTTLGGR
jgi:hypothetical protein